MGRSNIAVPSIYKEVHDLGHPALHPIPHHQVHHQVETLCPKNWTETLFLKVLSECLKAFGKIQKNSHLSGRYIWILFKAQHGDFEIIEVKTHSRLNFVISTLIFFLRQKKTNLNLRNCYNVSQHFFSSKDKGCAIYITAKNNS